MYWIYKQIESEVKDKLFNLLELYIFNIIFFKFSCLVTNKFDIFLGLNSIFLCLYISVELFNLFIEEQWWTVVDFHQRCQDQVCNKMKNFVIGNKTCIRPVSHICFLLEDVYYPNGWLAHSHCYGIMSCGYCIIWLYFLYK